MERNFAGLPAPCTPSGKVEMVHFRKEKSKCMKRVYVQAVCPSVVKGKASIQDAMFLSWCPPPPSEANIE